MAAIHMIHTNRHGQHPSFQKVFDPLKKVVLEVLFSNEFTSRSGIYKITSGELSSRVACAALDSDGKPVYDEDGCLKIIDADEIKKIIKKLAKEDEVIFYDPKSHIVCLKDFLLAVPFGLSAKIVSEALCKEYKNHFIKEYWDYFFFNYGKHVLDYIGKAEKESETRYLKYIKDFNDNPKNKGKPPLLIEDYKDQITTLDMAALKGLIAMHGYDDKKVVLIKNYLSDN